MTVSRQGGVTGPRYFKFFPVDDSRRDWRVYLYATGSQTVPARRRAAAREKVRDARAQDAENTKATDPVLRAAEREHSSVLQPERNALLEDMTRLFLIPQRYAASRTADPVLGHD